MTLTDRQVEEIQEIKDRRHYMSYGIEDVLSDVQNDLRDLLLVLSGGTLRNW